MTESSEEYFGDRQDEQQFQFQERPWGLFVFLFVFALFWNAISLFVIVCSLVAAGPILARLGMIAAAIPFVVLGLGMDIGVVDVFLACCGRRPRLVAWAFQKMTGRSGKSFDDSQDAEDEEQPVSPGPVQLQSNRSRWRTCAGLFLVVLLFAMGWNGVMMVVLSDVFAEADADSKLFVIPFALIGVVLVIAAIYSFLALFNPVPVVVVDNGDLIPGSRTTVRWSFRGNPSNLRSFALTLVGRESATYLSDNSSHTASKEFCEVTFFESDVPAAIAAGSAEVTLPERTMHTFSARHNKIEWFIRARGKIPFWPDVQEEFPLTVYPS